MQAVDERAEVVRRAEARRRRVVAGHLVAPRARERVLHDRHQLDVREAELERVVGELVGQLLVGQRAVALERVEAPGAEVHLVDRHRRGVRLARAPPLQPGLVAPAVRRLEDDRARARRQLGAQRERVGLEARRRRPRRGSRTCSARPRSASGTKSSQTPARPSERIGCARSSQALKSPTTLTARAAGAQTAKAVPVRSVERARMRAERVPERSWRPSLIRCRSSSPSVGGKEYASRTTIGGPSG